MGAGSVSCSFSQTGSYFEPEKRQNKWSDVTELDALGKEMKI